MMEDWQKRVVHEQQELSAKVEKLQAFIGNPLFHSLSNTEKVLMNGQLSTMRIYLAYLDARIGLFT